MPGYRGHLIGGTAAFVITRFLLIPVIGDASTVDAVYLALTLLGSLFPDVDIKSKGQKIFYSLAFIIAAMAIAKRYWNCLSWLGLMCFIPLVLPHRGPMHNPYVLIATPWVISSGLQGLFPHILKLSRFYHLFFITGALSHLVLDFGLKRTLKKFLFSK
ncbi:hypothetical protein FJ366_02580 [Candidatus Dependentiae bacterium]|nr:hypothetical protein [Candidatus Dependentiae bacterium]